MFLPQASTAGNYGIFQLNAQGQWVYTARMAYDYLSPGQSLSDLFTVKTNDGLEATVRLTIDGTAEGDVVRLGAAPDRQTGAGGQWAQAWTQDGFAITHKANVADLASPWTAVKFTSVGNAQISGGDIFAGDLGVSGQNLATTAIKQEIDGAEALRVSVAREATSVTVKLANFFINDDGSVYAESGRLRLLDGAGQVVAETIFTANSADGARSITLTAAQGFSALELTSGAVASGAFVFGAYDNRGVGVPSYLDANSKLHGSDFLLDELEFHFQPAPLVGVVPPVGVEHEGP